MSFDSLSYRYIFTTDGIPERWLPLIHLYDPDLPLFPIYYFHILNPDLPQGERPSESQRIYGYIEKVNFLTGNRAEITVVSNKDISAGTDLYRQAVQTEVKERLGIVNPVTRTDIENVFSGSLTQSNPVLKEMWHRVVSYAYGDKLPFGRLWDEVFGLVRFVSSWNPPQGRKSELIQTHYFLSKFGVRIQSASHIPSNDFYLLPTIHEITDINNPLSLFPAFSRLTEVALHFHRNYCEEIAIGSVKLSRFTNPMGGKFDTAKLNQIFNSPHISFQNRPYAIECYNAFDKGPQRTVIFLMMLDDIRNKRINPKTLTKEQCGSIYDGLIGESSYQSPKVIQIYAQQSFGNMAAMPIDTWIDTFFKWPLMVYDNARKKQNHARIFSQANNLGKVERLLWVTAQSRKVHSSACDDAIWCIKKSSNGEPRGANPLGCNICLDAIRDACPAYRAIRNMKICFNSERDEGVAFRITTSSNNNTISNQKFKSCTGESIYTTITDDFSPVDKPDGFAPFPAQNHDGSVITVEDFVRIY
jgi:hypothetical protein